MAMMGNISKSMAGAAAGKMLSALNIEMGSLGRDMAAATAQVPEMLQALQKSLGGAAGGMSTLAANSLAAGQLSQVVAKVVFVSVLTEAIDKAGKSAHFNVETAINDLWVHLDATRKFSGGGAASGSPSIDGELQKLQRLVQKRAQLFSVLNAIAGKADQSAKNVIQNMRG